MDLIYAKHPILERLSDSRIDVFRLQYVESDIMMSAILRLLREHRIPSLPVFDCLIVREGNGEAQRAKSIMEEEFHKAVGVAPRVVAKCGHRFIKVLFPINDD